MNSETHRAHLAYQEVLEREQRKMTTSDILNGSQVTPPHVSVKEAAKSFCLGFFLGAPFAAIIFMAFSFWFFAIWGSDVQ